MSRVECKGVFCACDIIFQKTFLSSSTELAVMFKSMDERHVYPEVRPTSKMAKRLRYLYDQGLFFMREIEFTSYMRWVSVPALSILQTIMVFLWA